MATSEGVINISLTCSHNGTDWVEPNAPPKVFGKWDFTTGMSTDDKPGGFKIVKADGQVVTIPASALAAGVNVAMGKEHRYNTSTASWLNGDGDGQYINQGKRTDFAFKEAGFGLNRLVAKVTLLQPINFNVNDVIWLDCSTVNISTWQVGDRLTTTLSGSGDIEEIYGSNVYVRNDSFTKNNAWRDPQTITNVTRGETITITNTATRTNNTKFFLGLTNGAHGGGNLEPGAYLDPLGYSHGYFGVEFDLADSQGNAQWKVTAGGNYSKADGTLKNTDTRSNQSSTPTHAVDKSDNGKVTEYIFDFKRSEFEGDTNTWLRVYKKAPSTGDVWVLSFEDFGFEAYWILSESEGANRPFRTKFNTATLLGNTDQHIKQDTSVTGDTNMVWYVLDVSFGDDILLELP